MSEKARSSKQNFRIEVACNGYHRFLDLNEPQSNRLRGCLREGKGIYHTVDLNGVDIYINIANISFIEFSKKDRG
jgi:hypothetical protein